MEFGLDDLVDDTTTSHEHVSRDLDLFVHLDGFVNQFLFGLVDGQGLSLWLLPGLLLGRQGKG